MPNQVVYTFLASDRFTRVARSVAKQTRSIRTQFQKLQIDARRLGAGMTALGTKMRTTSLIATAAAVGMLKSFGDLEQGVNSVLTLLDSPEEIESFRGRIRRLSEDAIQMGFSIGDSNKALFDTVSAMGANQQAFDVFRVSQKLAIAGVTQLGVATDGITSIVNAYGKETTDANEVANAFFTAQKKGKTTVAALSANIGKVAKDAQLAGVGFKDLLAFTSQLTLGGLSTEEATTGLKNALVALRNPGTQAERVLRAFGVPVGTSEIRAAGLGETLRKLAIVSERFPDVLAEAIPNIRAFTAAASLGGAELKNVDAIVRQINEDIEKGTGLNEAFALQQTAFNEEMKRTFGSIKVLASQIGEVLVPVVKVIGSLTRSATAAFSAMNPVVRTITGSLVTLTAIAAPILIFFGKFLVVAKAVAVGIGAVVSAVGAPMLFIIGGISAGIISIVSNWRALKREFTLPAAFNFLKSFFQEGGALDITGAAAGRNTFSGEIALGINAPEGVVNSVKFKGFGGDVSLSTGINREGQL